jgi:hypothetical protein
LGTATIQPGSLVATLNATQLTNGQHTITANYNGDTNYTASSSPPTDINLQPDFIFGIQGDTVLVIPTPGATATSTLIMTDLDGYTGAVTFTCSGLPAESSCTFNPSTLSSTDSLTLTVTTTAKTGMLKERAPGQQWPWVLAVLGTPLLGIVLLPLPLPRRSLRRLGITLLLGISFVSCGGGSGTGGGGGGGGNPGTPTGNYTVTITGTGGTGNNAITHTETFLLGIE